MLKSRRFFAALFASALLAVGLASAAAAQQQDGLVNVMIGDITIEDVNVAVAAQIVANVCANVDLDAALTLVGDVDQTSDANQVCRIGRAGRGPELTITQN